MAIGFSHNRRFGSGMAAAVARRRSTAISAKDQTHIREDGLAESSRAAVLGDQRKLWSGRRCARYRRVSEPAVFEPRTGTDTIGNWKGRVDSDGRVGGRILLLGLG